MRAAAPEAPPAVARALEQLLAPAPEGRPATAEAAAALLDAAAGVAGAAPPAGPAPGLVGRRDVAARLAARVAEAAGGRGGVL